MIKLWLDDSRDPGSEWIWVKDGISFETMVSTMDNIPFMSLDHDLSSAAYAPTGLDCVTWYTQYLFDTEKVICPRITIHSMNPQGAENMAFHLRSYVLRTQSICEVVIRPYGDFISKISTRKNHIEWR